MSEYVTCTCGAEINFFERVCSLGHGQTWLPAGAKPIKLDGYSRHGAMPVTATSYLSYEDIALQINHTYHTPMAVVRDVLDTLIDMGVDLLHIPNTP